MEDGSFSEISVSNYISQHLNPEDHNQEIPFKGNSITGKNSETNVYEQNELWLTQMYVLKLTD
jgi:hypothetical protein